VKQDHRFIKRLVKPAMGFFSVETAGQTFQGDEAMHMIRKGQMKGVNKGDVTEQKGEGRCNSPRTTHRRNSKKI
jgi:transposase-like protein